MGSVDFSYFNARLRGMRSALLGRRDYEVLAGLDGIARYAEHLRSTAYGPYMETASARARRPDEIIAQAVRSSLAASFAAMQRTAPPEAQAYIRALLSMWEVYDLKVILRGVTRSIPAAEALEALVPAGEFDSAAIKTLLNNAKDAPDLISFLETWGSRYAAPLKDGLPAHRKNGSTALMEHNLDVMCMASLRKGMDGRGVDPAIMREFISAKVDVSNIMTLVKLSGEGRGKDEAQGLFIEGGRRLNRDGFVKLLDAKDRDELLTMLGGVLRDKRWRAIIEGALADDPAFLEERLEAAQDDSLRGLAVTEPMSIALAASYMQMKAREVKNLRVIARGIAFGIPEDVLKRYIIYPM